MIYLHLIFFWHGGIIVHNMLLSSNSSAIIFDNIKVTSSSQKLPVMFTKLMRIWTSHDIYIYDKIYL